jgi:glucokinase
MDVYFAIDIGGTQLRAGLYPANSTTPIAMKKISTRGRESAVDRLISLISELWPAEGYTVRGIGADAPGPLDSKTGVIYKAPNIPAWKNLPLRQILEDHFHVPVILGNDANLAALGEWRFGAGQGHHDLIYFTISTGIGGGVISSDQLLLGARGLAAELGHVTIMDGGPLCGCGQRGHLEAVSSGTGIAKYVNEQLSQGRASSLPKDPPVTARQVSEAATNGDALAVEAMQRAGHYMGVAIANYLHIFNPTIVILGGGVTHSGPIFFDPLHAALKSHVLSSMYLQDLVITRAALGDDAGLMGSLALIQSHTS